jgi:hypothetical protein
MTIADKLTSINNSKTAIKNAIETKGVTVGSAPLADYASKILEIEGGGGPVFPDPEPTPWVRPEDWLPMPEILETEDKIAILVAVYNDTSNIVGFNCIVTNSSTYTVDWGDGIVETLTGFAQHNYNWDDVDSTSLTSRGYRQAMIIITPASGESFTTFRSSIRFGMMPVDGYVQPFLEMSLNCPGEPNTSLSFSNLNITAANAWACLLESIKIRGQNLFQGVDGFLAHCYSLRKVDLISGPGNFIIGNTLTSTFLECHNLEEVPDLYTLNTGFTSTFQGCTSLKKIGTLTVGATTGFANWGSCFSGCSSLTKLPEIVNNNPSAITSIAGTFSGCTCLTYLDLSDWNISALFSSTFLNCKSLQKIVFPEVYTITGLLRAFDGCSSLKELNNLRVSTASPVSFDTAFSGCESLSQLSFALGVPQPSTLLAAFSNCLNLETIPELDTSSVTAFSSAFANCNSLKFIDWDIDCSNATLLTSMFSGCLSLRNAPNLINVNPAGRTVTTMNNMFNNCFNMETVQLFDTSKTANVGGMFAQCRNLTEIPPFNFAATSSAANGTYLGSGTGGTTRGFITRRIRVTGNRFAHNVRSMNLDANALNEVFTGLGTASGSQAITITNNPGAATCDRSIATAKGWTVTG